MDVSWTYSEIFTTKKYVALTLLPFFITVQNGFRLIRLLVQKILVASAQIKFFYNFESVGKFSLAKLRL